MIRAYPTLIYLFFKLCKKLYEYLPTFDNIISYVDSSDDDESSYDDDQSSYDDSSYYSSDDNSSDDELSLALNQIQT